MIHEMLYKGGSGMVDFIAIFILFVIVYYSLNR